MKWTRAYKDKLPDDSFLVISPGGHKDRSGRTVPRTLRHLPVRDLRGNVSVSHVRNALARIAHTDISAAQKKIARAKAERLLTDVRWEKPESMAAYRKPKRKTTASPNRAPSLKTAKLRASVQKPAKKRRRK